MASTRTETAITWPTGQASQTCSVNATIYPSDVISFDAEDWDGEVMLWADNQGTPASGDLVTFGILYSVGSVDGSAGDDFNNLNNYEFLAQLDTYNNDESGADGVVLRTVPIRTTAKSFKIVANAPVGTTRNIVVRAALITRRNAVA